MRKLSCVLTLVAVLGASGASAAIRTVGNVSLTAPKVSARGGAIVQYASIPDMQVSEGQETSFAELTFEEVLDPRTEVEIWPAIEGEVEPWDVPEIVAAFGRNLWVVDDRTGSFVKFDVTAIVKAWESEALPNHGFEVRVLPDADGAEQGSVDRLVRAGEAPKVTLRIFTHPPMPLGDGTGGTGN